MKTWPVWELYEANKDDQTIAECKLYKTKVARGDTKSMSFNTSKFLKHLLASVSNQEKCGIYVPTCIPPSVAAGMLTRHVSTETVVVWTKSLNKNITLHEWT